MKRLQELMKSYIETHGRKGIIELMLAIDRSEQTIQKYASGKIKINQDRAYALAKRCGVSATEAKEIAHEIYLENKGA